MKKLDSNIQLFDKKDLNDFEKFCQFIQIDMSGRNSSLCYDNYEEIYKKIETFLTNNNQQVLTYDKSEVFEELKIKDS